MGTARFRHPVGVESPLGAIVLTAELVDDEPYVPPQRRMDSWVLSYVSAGRGEYHDAAGNRWPIERGSVTLVSPGTSHWYGTPPGRRWSELAVVFTGPIFDLLADAAILTDRTPCRADPLPPPSLLRAVVRSEPPDRAGLERTLLTLVGWLSDLHATDAPTVGSPTDELLRRSALRLAADLTARLDLHELARECGLSYDTFRRRFAIVHGSPPAAYRTAARMAAAARLITLTNRGLRDIATRLGYGDEFHFSRRFRDHHGIPPSEFRRQWTGAIPD